MEQSAKFLVEALGGEEQAYKTVGGTKWWQVRAGPGVEAEWIAMKKEWKEQMKSERAKGASKADAKANSARADQEADEMDGGCE